MNGPMISPDNPNYDAAWAEYRASQENKEPSMWKTGLHLFEAASTIYLVDQHLSKKQAAKQAEWDKAHPPTPPRPTVEVVISDIRGAYDRSEPERVWGPEMGISKLAMLIRKLITDDGMPVLVVGYEDWDGHHVLEMIPVSMVSGRVLGWTDAPPNKLALT